MPRPACNFGTTVLKFLANSPISIAYLHGYTTVNTTRHSITLKDRGILRLPAPYPASGKRMLILA
jgi:hypothetical protein